MARSNPGLRIGIEIGSCRLINEKLTTIVSTDVGEFTAPLHVTLDDPQRPVWNGRCITSVSNGSPQPIDIQVAFTQQKWELRLNGELASEPWSEESSPFYLDFQKQTLRAWPGQEIDVLVTD